MGRIPKNGAVPASLSREHPSRRLIMRFNLNCAHLAKQNPLQLCRPRARAAGMAASWPVDALMLCSCTRTHTTARHAPATCPPPPVASSPHADGGGALLGTSASATTGCGGGTDFANHVRPLNVRSARTSRYVDAI
uniref:Uncharacterized protein n=1 Tax=Prymnesium polylepis TaxID=72548 RepID=A0A7S4J5H9_9EUKA